MKEIVRNGIPLRWRVFFALILLSFISLFLIPDSLSKGIFTQILNVAVLVGGLAGFFHNKHPVFPWGYLLIGSLFLGASITLGFLSRIDITINATLVSTIGVIGMLLILAFAFSVSFIYEKKLNLSGLVIDIALLALSIIVFFLFIHPTLLNVFIYELDIIQKLYFLKVLTSVLILFMSLIINGLYRAKRPQLLLLIPVNTLLLIHLLIQGPDTLNPLEKVHLYSPLSTQLFVLVGMLAVIFSFIETFSDQSIAENHLEIEKTFIRFSSDLMRVTIIISVIVIPIAIIIRLIFNLPDISLLLIVTSILVMSLIAIGRLTTIIKESQEQQQKLLTITQTNKLTGLINYAGLYDCLFNRNIKTLLIIMLNVDDFKSTNHYYGRKFGDEILKSLARKLENAPDTLAYSHIETDVFIVAYQVEEADIKETIARLTKHLDVWDTVLEKEVAVPLTFGACYTSDAKKLETKFRYAEQALRSARTMHINQYMFELSDKEQELPRHELQRILQQAIKKNHLPVHFQPIYNLKDGSLKALELLIRVESEEHGILLPKQFLDQALSYGLLTSLTKVCISMVAEYSELLPNVTININLPPYILKNSEILSDLIKHIQDVGLDPKRLCFEITEDENIRADQLVSQVKYLTDQSFTIAMDDFGTGYSSLERLSLLPFDTIKIDRSLLLAASNGNKTILESSIGLIKRLGETVVVEGVETLEQLSLIKKLGADSVQGFLLSRPIPILKIDRLPKNISEVVSEY